MNERWRTPMKQNEHQRTGTNASEAARTPTKRREQRRSKNENGGQFPGRRCEILKRD